jgi:hypothetical protein
MPDGITEGHELLALPRGNKAVTSIKNNLE